MVAQPFLVDILKALREHGLEAILIGNAAAALHGAPVTTVDFDFMFRETPLNIRKLKAVSRSLEAVILRPFYPTSKLYRVVNDDRGLQIDFMSMIHGVRSFESLRSRSVPVTVAGYELRLASLPDIISSKRAAGRARDRAVLEVLEKTLNEKETVPATQQEKSPRSARRGK